jgi:hypothetical protein
MHNEIVGIAPATGALRWQHPVKATMSFHFNIATPIWGEGDLLFAAAAYGVGRTVFSHAMLLHADGKMIILDEDGTLGLATAAPRGLTVHSRARILRSPAWTAPTLISGILYVRERHTIAALRVGPQLAPAAVARRLPNRR